MWYALAVLSILLFVAGGLFLMGAITYYCLRIAQYYFKESKAACEQGASLGIFWLAMAGIETCALLYCMAGIPEFIESLGRINI